MENKESLQLCDACCEGRLHPKSSNEAAENKDIQGQFVIHYSVCDVCNAEIIDAADSLRNKREWVRLKKRVDNIPLGAEIMEMRRKHNLTQPIAAAIFGGGPVAFSKYENDDLIPDEAMVSLLKLAIAFPNTVRRLAEIKKIMLPAQKAVQSDVHYMLPSKLNVLFFTSVPRGGTTSNDTFSRYLKGTKSKDRRMKTRKTILKRSGELTKKIVHGGSLWTVQ